MGVDEGPVHLDEADQIGPCVYHRDAHGHADLLGLGHRRRKHLLHPRRRKLLGLSPGGDHHGAEDRESEEGEAGGVLLVKHSNLR